MCDFISIDPNIILPIGLVFGGVTLLFITGVVIYYLFKVDIVLWLRRTFPVLYANKGEVSKQVSNYSCSFFCLLFLYSMRCDGNVSTHK